jgi:NAD(P)-dependent dehydrogenase (short-subunit alcohol dehydrogenase family)
MKDDIRGEVAVVTGASRGLGLLLADELARHGCPRSARRSPSCGPRD